MSVNGKKFDFSKFNHYDTDPEKERNGVPVTVSDSGVVLQVRRAGGRNYGFEKHRNAVVERWQKTHGRGQLSGDDNRAQQRDVMVHCLCGWNEDVVGVPYSEEAAREALEIEAFFQIVMVTAFEWESYRRDKVADAKDAVGNA